MVNGQLIKSLREARKLTVKQFAKEVGIDFRTIQAIEAGKSVNLQKLAKVAEKFNLMVGDLING